jgi:hypothetical protein
VPPHTLRRVSLSQRVKLTYDEPRLNYAFNFDLRHYVKDGVVPVKRLFRTSQIKGVSWDKHLGKWTAKCNWTSLGYHATVGQCRLNR